ncbi:MAG: glutamate racemase, partial [Oscillospiraceae bacterium]
TTLVAKQYLKTMLLNNVDTLILGCTHFPIIIDIISQIMGENVCLIDSGKEAGKVAFSLLEETNSMRVLKMSPSYKFFVSDTVKHFNENATTILNEKIPGIVEKINIEKY